MYAKGKPPSGNVTESPNSTLASTDIEAVLSRVPISLEASLIATAGVFSEERSSKSGHETNHPVLRTNATILSGEPVHFDEINQHITPPHLTSTKHRDQGCSPKRSQLQLNEKEEEDDVSDEVARVIESAKVSNKPKNKISYPPLSYTTDRSLEEWRQLSLSEQERSWAWKLREYASSKNNTAEGHGSPLPKRSADFVPWAAKHAREQAHGADHFASSAPIPPKLKSRRLSKKPASDNECTLPPKSNSAVTPAPRLRTQFRRSLDEQQFEKETRRRSVVKAATPLPVLATEVRAIRRLPQQISSDKRDTSIAAFVRSPLLSSPLSRSRPHCTTFSSTKEESCTDLRNTPTTATRTRFSAREDEESTALRVLYAEVSNDSTSQAKDVNGWADIERIREAWAEVIGVKQRRLRASSRAILVIASTRYARSIRTEEHFHDRVRELAAEFTTELAAAHQLQGRSLKPHKPRAVSGRALDHPAFMGGVTALSSWNLNAARSLWMLSHRDNSEETAANRKTGSLGAAWHGSPFKVLLLGNLVWKLRLKLVLRAFAVNARAAATRRKLVDTRCSIRRDYTLARGWAALAIYYAQHRWLRRRCEKRAESRRLVLIRNLLRQWAKWARAHVLHRGQCIHAELHSERRNLWRTFAAWRLRVTKVRIQAIRNAIALHWHDSALVAHVFYSWRAETVQRCVIKARLLYKVQLNSVSVRGPRRRASCVLYNQSEDTEDLRTPRGSYINDGNPDDGDNDLASIFPMPGYSTPNGVAFSESAARRRVAILMTGSLFIEARASAIRALDSTRWGRLTTIEPLDITNAISENEGTQNPTNSGVSRHHFYAGWLKLGRGQCQITAATGGRDEDSDSHYRQRRATARMMQEPVILGAGRLQALSLARAEDAINLFLHGELLNSSTLQVQSVAASQQLARRTRRASRHRRVSRLLGEQYLTRLQRGTSEGSCSDSEGEDSSNEFSEDLRTAQEQFPFNKRCNDLSEFINADVSEDAMFEHEIAIDVQSAKAVFGRSPPPPPPEPPPPLSRAGVASAQSRRRLRRTTAISLLQLSSSATLSTNTPLQGISFASLSASSRVGSQQRSRQLAAEMEPPTFIHWTSGIQLRESTLTKEATLVDSTGESKNSAFSDDLIEAMQDIYTPSLPSPRTLAEQLASRRIKSRAFEIWIHCASLWAAQRRALSLRPKRLARNGFRILRTHAVWRTTRRACVHVLQRRCIFRRAFTSWTQLVVKWRRIAMGGFFAPFARWRRWASRRSKRKRLVKQYATLNLLRRAFKRLQETHRRRGLLYRVFLGAEVRAERDKVLRLNPYLAQFEQMSFAIRQWQAGAQESKRLRLKAERKEAAKLYLKFKLLNATFCAWRGYCSRKAARRQVSMRAEEMRVTTINIVWSTWSKAAARTRSLLAAAQEQRKNRAKLNIIKSWASWAQLCLQNRNRRDLAIFTSRWRWAAHSYVLQRAIEARFCHALQFRIFSHFRIAVHNSQRQRVGFRWRLITSRAAVAAGWHGPIGSNTAVLYRAFAVWKAYHNNKERKRDLNRIAKHFRQLHHPEHFFSSATTTSMHRGDGASSINDADISCGGGRDRRIEIGGGDKRAAFDTLTDCENHMVLPKTTAAKPSRLSECGRKNWVKRDHGGRYIDADGVEYDNARAVHDTFGSSPKVTLLTRLRAPAWTRVDVSAAEIRARRMQTKNRSFIVSVNPKLLMVPGGNSLPLYKLRSKGSWSTSSSLLNEF